MGRKILPKEIHCSVCGKLLSKINFDEHLFQSLDKDSPNKYWVLNIGDYKTPVNNLETYYLCSKKCINQKYSEYLTKSMKSKDTMYFELRYERVTVK